MTTLYERIGHGEYVNLVEAVAGKKLPRLIRNAKPPKAAPDHQYAKCGKPYNCKQHRAEYRRRLKARKQSIVAAELAAQQHRTDTEIRQVDEKAESVAFARYQKEIKNIQAMHRVAGNTVNNPTVSVDSL